MHRLISQLSDYKDMASINERFGLKTSVLFFSKKTQDINIFAEGEMKTTTTLYEGAF